MNSWGMYLAASVALLLILSPQLAGVARDAREGADWRGIDGVREVIDALSPGVAVATAFGVGGGDNVTMGGHELTCVSGSDVLRMATKWALSNATLTPGVQYLVWLQGGIVMVEEIG